MIVVTEAGIVILLKPEQPRKANLLIVVTVEGIVVFLQPANKVLIESIITALQLSLESYTFPVATEILVKLSQKAKTCSLISKIFGEDISTLVKYLQLLNTL